MVILHGERIEPKEIRWPGILMGLPSLSKNLIQFYVHRKNGCIVTIVGEGVKYSIRLLGGSVILYHIGVGVLMIHLATELASPLDPVILFIACQRAQLPQQNACGCRCERIATRRAVLSITTGGG